MSLSYYYWLYPGLVTDEDCDKIIQYGKKLNQQKGLTHGEESQYLRNSDIAWIEEDYEIQNLLMDRVLHANASAGWNYHIDTSESPQFTQYGKDQFYDWHTDGPMDISGVYRRKIPGITDPDKDGTQFVGKARKVSVTLQLSDPADYEGGEFEFRYGGHEITADDFKTRGSIIVFPSFLEHRVKPVTKGTRYSCVMWALGRQFR